MLFFRPQESMIEIQVKFKDSPGRYIRIILGRTSCIWVIGFFLLMKKEIDSELKLFVTFTASIFSNIRLLQLKKCLLLYFILQKLRLNELKDEFRWYIHTKKENLAGIFPYHLTQFRLLFSHKKNLLPKLRTPYVTLLHVKKYVCIPPIPRDLFISIFPELWAR